MIGLIFTLGPELVEVRVDGNSILFRNNDTNGNFVTIEGLKLNKVGVIKEHPDLKGEEDWEDIARNRFKNHINKMKTEQKKVDYIVEDLKKFGYKIKYKQRKGFRVEKVKEN